MSLQDKFFAAVEVVNSIPYDGTFEPSDEIMLKFYAYYKQATEGPCNDPKPFIWNAASRNKWNAWNELENMSAETAMENYIEQLSKVIETMSYNDKIAHFFSLMGSFYEVVSQEEIDSQQNRIQNEKWSEEMIPSIFENYESPTLSDLYHINKRDSPDAIKNNEENHQITRNTSSVQPGYSQSTITNPHFSTSSASSTSSEFDLLSDSSGHDSIVIIEPMFNNHQTHCTMKNDLFILTLLNLENSMKDILAKLEELNELAHRRHKEEISLISKYNAMTKWNLNITCSAIAFLWPIVVGAILG